MNGSALRATAVTDLPVDAGWSNQARRRAGAIVAYLLFLIAASGSLVTANRTNYNDEVLWQERSQQFATGLITGDARLLTAYNVNFDTTSASITMPGIPTLWVGSGVIIAECATSDTPVSLGECVKQSSGPSLPNAHRAMALFGAASVAPVAGESSAPGLDDRVPCLPSGCNKNRSWQPSAPIVFHTDSLVMSFSLIGFVALCRALESWQARNTTEVALGALAGVTLAGAALTKLSAAAVVLRSSSA